MFLSRSPLACALAACLTVALAVLQSDVGIASAEQSADAPRVRGLWVTRSALRSPTAIAQMVSAAESGGFNTLFVQVRGRGDAYYHSSLEPRASELASRPGFDPLADTLRLAGPAGLKVHAWIAVNLVASAVDLPASRQHVIYRQPDWLMVPRELAVGLMKIDPRSPEYIGRLARWTRARPDEVEGLYVSPIHSWAATHAEKLVADLVRAYRVDGVHLDYVRFPRDDFDYSRAALQQFKLTIRPQLSVADRRRADAQDRVDPLAYPSRFPDRWITFRQSRVTALVARVRKAIKAVRPEMVLSAAVIPDAAEAAEKRFQDWRTWLDQSLIDAVCPMAYTQDVKLFVNQISAAREFAGDRPVWAGIGAYRLSPAATVERVAAARRLKAAGIILFSYDALVSPPNSVTSLAELGRAAFGSGSP